MVDRPVLESIAGPLLDRLEVIFRDGRGSRTAREDLAAVAARGHDHHFGKVDSHLIGAGPFFNGIEQGTDIPHLELALARLILTWKCALGAENERP